MISNNQIRFYSHYKDTKLCATEQVFVAEGAKLADEVLKEGISLRAVIATSEWLGGNGHRIGNGVDVMEASGAALERVSSMRTPNGVWMLAERPTAEQTLRRHPQPDDNPLAAIVTDRIQDPGNMGTILRLADWYGVRQVVCSPDSVGCFTPKVVQASMGSVLRVATMQAALAEYLGQCRRQGLAVYGATLGGDNVYRHQLKRPAVLLIGNESQGICNELLGLLDHAISIPNRGGTCESLNAAVATAILCSEFFRSSDPQND
ncbi:MAG: RNA methyltransferase [Bacteroidales bacterium]|nr:RNA methyltransferase [Bacteroidales bacterium]